MADFGQHMQSLRPCQPFSEMDMNMELLKHFAELKPSVLQNLNLPLPHPCFSVETPLAHQLAEFPVSCNLGSCFGHFQTNSQVSVPGGHTMSGNGNVFLESKKRKVTEQSKSISKNISFSASTIDFQGDDYKNKRNRSRKGKKVRISEKKDGKPEEIIHVRAKRGQATDSHSRAERVRREKINKKMRCLQDLVPGCHKAMGMAGMLEEIINYVHSLQNQVEFLSTELAAACSSQDLNFEIESSRKAQETDSQEAMVMEKWAKEAYEEYSCFHSTWSL